MEDSGTIPFSVTSNAVVTQEAAMPEPFFSEGGRVHSQCQACREEGPETGVCLSPLI